jgi:putative transcriptional regulator|nr:XRE family transcriptional regulator [Bacillota bacterium]
MKRLRLRLDDELKRRGMTQTQLIELTGMRPTTISEMVRNVRSRWDIRNIERVADALGIDPRDLIESYEE